MPIAIYASKIFQVSADYVYTFTDFLYKSSLQTEKQDSKGIKPSTYNKGPDLDTLSFSIKLDVDMGLNPRQEWESWQNILNSQVAHPFILGTKPLGPNKWLLISVSPGNEVFDNEGNILSLELALQFDEYVRPGTQKASSTGVGASTTTAPGISGESYEQLENEIFDIENKASYKRKNPNMPLDLYRPYSRTTENPI